MFLSIFIDGKGRCEYSCETGPKLRESKYCGGDANSED